MSETIHALYTLSCLVLQIERVCRRFNVWFRVCVAAICPSVYNYRCVTSRIVVAIVIARTCNPSTLECAIQKETEEFCKCYAKKRDNAKIRNLTQIWSLLYNWITLLDIEAWRRQSFKSGMSNSNLLEGHTMVLKNWKTLARCQRAKVKKKKNSPKTNFYTIFLVIKSFEWLNG